MSPTGTYQLGPDNATLVVRTGKTGPAAKAGHNLVIEVTAWSATLTLGPETAISLSAEAGSLRVLEGSGGVQALDEDDKDAIRQTIGDDVLKGKPIEFRSSHAVAEDGALRVEGELTLTGTPRPVAFALRVDDDGGLSASARIKQTDFGMKPYSTLFGTLKVADEVEVAITGSLPSA
jgi:polyisoprenoid-binding protein YceI